VSLRPAADAARALPVADRALTRRARGLLLLAAAIAVVALSLGVAVAVDATVGIRVDTPAGR
jgi:hypothetical protein